MTSCASWCFHSDEISNVGRQLLDSRVVEALDVLEHALVLLRDEVDGDTLASEPPAATDTVKVALGLGGQVVVDHQRDLRPTQSVVATR